MQPVTLNFWVYQMLQIEQTTNQQENALLMVKHLKETKYKINKSTVICNQYLWIFGSDTSCYLQNQQINSSTAQQLNSSTAQQINKSTAQQVNKSTVQCLNRSTNQQWSATSSSEFSGLTQAVIYKINKSTGKRAINTQRRGRNPW